MKKMMLTGISWVIAGTALSQVLFKYGTNEVTKDEFIKTYYRNKTSASNKGDSIKEYLDLYIAFKLKVKAAKDQQLDTISLLKYDLINFRHRLENDYPVNLDEAFKQTNYRRNTLVTDDDLFRFADSVTLIPGEKEYAIGKKLMFTLGKAGVKASEWLSFVKNYKLNYSIYKGESNQQLLDSFTNKTVARFYRNHLEEYNEGFKYQLQFFNEGNLVFEAMKRNVWAKSGSNEEVLKQYYHAHKDHFLWQQSADVILVNARYYAYAAYASENMQKGTDWRKIAATSEGMILADSGRYELTQLPLKTGAVLVEGGFTEIVKNDADNGAAFVRVQKVYPAKQERSFEEAKNQVIAAYQNQLEQNWMNDLNKKYPVTINDTFFNKLALEIEK